MSGEQQRGQPDRGSTKLWNQIQRLPHRTVPDHVAQTHGTIIQTLARVREILTAWGDDENLQVAAAIVAIADLKAAGWLEKKRSKGLDSWPLPADLQELATATRRWRDREFAESVPEATLKQRLREFLRDSYARQPDVRLPILLLAFHDAPSKRGDGWRRLNATVYIVLAELFGVWALRRAWRRELLGGPTPKALAPIETAAAAVLEEAARDARLTGQPHLINVSSGPQHSSRSQAPRAHVVCATPEDCYRLIGSLHDMATPLNASGQRLGMIDYIASPKATGYRAFVTTIRTKNPQVDVQFHVSTSQMRRLNEYGVVAWHHHTSLFEQTPVWWAQHQALSDQLLTEFNYPLKLKAFIDSSDRGDAPAIYVLTPKAEMKLLPPQSTVLDFAYSLHTSLGDEASGFEVNERSVPFNYRLQNADVVVVRRDPPPPKPELSWLSALQTKRARTRVERRLRVDTPSQHPAMALVQSHVARVIRFYRNARRFVDLSIDDKRLQLLLLRVAKTLKLSGVDELLDPIAESMKRAAQDAGRLADRLAHRIIREEFADQLIAKDGSSLDVVASRISFCADCRPVPGDSISAGWHKAPRGTPRLHVHQKGCELLALHANSVDLRWLDTESGNESIANLTIRGRDRSNLLRDVVDAVKHLGLYLHQVRADVDQEGQADIDLKVGSRTAMHVDEIQETLMAIPDVLDLRFAAVTVRPLANTKRNIDGDFSEMYALGPRFFNRTEAIQRMNAWLLDPQAARWLVVHGEGRVGKTSLVRHFEKAVSRERSGEALYVDAQSLSQFTFNSFCRGVSNAMRTISTKRRLRFSRSRDAADQLLEALEERAKLCANQRLVVIIDEFSWIIAKAKPALLGRLRAMMERSQRTRWILVVHSHHYQETWSDWLGPLLRTHAVHVAHLDAVWGRKLIKEPIERAGCEIGDRAIDALLHLTDGNPYLINAIGRELIHRVRERPRKLIDLDEIEVGRAYALSDGHRLFWHFEAFIQGWHRVVFTAAASLQTQHPDQSSIAIDELVSSIRKHLPDTADERVGIALDALETRGLVWRSPDRLAVRLRLLAEWWMGPGKKSLESEIATFQQISRNPRTTKSVVRKHRRN